MFELDEASMASVPDSRTTAELLKAFSHPTRLSILQELIAGPKCVTDMEELLPARQANISQHLAVLRHARLVDYAQEGSLRCYYLCRPRLVEDMLVLIGRNDPVITRTPEEIRADKERLTKAQARSEASAKPTPRRRKAVS
jgi:ArsR family transcriptional regulator